MMGGEPIRLGIGWKSASPVVSQTSMRADLARSRLGQFDRRRAAWIRLRVVFVCVCVCVYIYIYRERGYRCYK